MKVKSTPSPTYRFAHTYSLLKSALQDRLRSNNLDVTVEQLAILRLLSQHDCISIKSISEHTFRDSSTATRIIDNLEKKKLLVRVPSEDDRRVRHICLSEKGKEIYAKASEIAKSHVANALKGIGTGDIEHLINLMNQIQYNLKKKTH